MTVFSRDLARKEVATGLTAVLVGTGLPCAAVFSYQVGRLGGASPVVEVMSGTIARGFAGMGTSRFDSNMNLEVHILIYDGDENNPLTEPGREDAADQIEALIAGWVSTHQRGTYYRALRFSGDHSERAGVKMLDGNPYQLEILKLELEVPDL
jgi:hypothetical protein